MFPASFAQSMVVFAILLKTKDRKLRNIALLAFVSGMFGVTEPCIYGITLPRKKPFIISCIAASVGGGILGIVGAKSYMMGGLGVFGLPSYIDNTTNSVYSLVWVGISMVISMVIAFVMTYITYKEEAPIAPIEEKETQKSHQKETIYAPISGSIVSLDKVEDDAFSTGALGKGLAIMPTQGKVYAPCDGTISTFFPTGHAIGIVSTRGVEVLIHIGIDTVKLNGEGFTKKVEQGDSIKKGQLLLEFDIDKITTAGFSIISPIIITNTESYTDVIEVEEKEIAIGDEIITLL